MKGYCELLSFFQHRPAKKSPSHLIGFMGFVRKSRGRSPWFGGRWFTSRKPGGVFNTTILRIYTCDMGLKWNRSSTMKPKAHPNPFHALISRLHTCGNVLSESRHREPRWSVLIPGFLWKVKANYLSTVRMHDNDILNSNWPVVWGGSRQFVFVRIAKNSTIWTY